MIPDLSGLRRRRQRAQTRAADVARTNRSKRECTATHSPKVSVGTCERPPPKRVGRAFALLTKTCHGSQVTGRVPYQDFAFPITPLSSIWITSGSPVIRPQSLRVNGSQSRHTIWAYNALYRTAGAYHSWIVRNSYEVSEMRSTLEFHFFSFRDDPVVFSRLSCLLLCDQCENRASHKPNRKDR